MKDLSEAFEILSSALDEAIDDAEKDEQTLSYDTVYLDDKSKMNIQ